MELPWLMRVISTLCLSITATLAVNVSLPGCQDKCGNVTIPFPFGIGSKCSANPSYTILCQNLTNPPRPFLSSIKLEVERIYIEGIVIVKHPVSPMNCSDGLRTENVGISLKGSPFTISAHYNSLVVMGCKNSVWLRTNVTTVGGCMALCDANSTDSSCNGVNCCQTTIPSRLQQIELSYENFRVNSSSPCGYVFPVDKKWLQNGDHKRYEGLLADPLNPFDQEFRFAPLSLEWEFGNLTNSSYGSCITPDSYCQGPRYYNQCVANPLSEYMIPSYYSTHDYVSLTLSCSCERGFEGNPYILEGCSDVDECRNATVCTDDETCINGLGYFSCQLKDYGYLHDRNRSGHEDDNGGFRGIMKIASIIIGSVLAGLILLTATWKFGKAIAKLIKMIKASRKYMFFKRNGGILLEQQLAVIENGIEKTRLFTSAELAKATDDYNENRILGRGGEGVVYKGMLEDGRIVAVKKLVMLNQSDAESFINEVVIVSQISHRNIVKLLGCCLESEVPRLVYEFIPNGTLFHHIHDPDENFPLFWEMRVRIAKEIAGALAYLHYAASVPIYHRDIKSTNILLDEKYRAKISDFGTSRSVLIDQTHVTTRVVGTFGYLDPEYFQSSQFTEKSDVYSFGVVLVELLTGEKAISAARVEEGRGLAMHFLHSMEGNQLLVIVDGRVLREGKKEDIEAMAGIAKKCLHLNGKGRPTMKEVARDLEAIQVEKEESEISQNQNGDNHCSATEDDDSDDSSSIIEINSPRTQHSL